jgi:hypothetical protein
VYPTNSEKDSIIYKSKYFSILFNFFLIPLDRRLTEQALNQNCLRVQGKKRKEKKRKEKKRKVQTRPLSPAGGSDL